MMVVTNKQSDIAILRTFGAGQQDILNIFIIQGALIGFVGTLIGLIFGVLGAWYISDIVRFIENLSGIHFLNPDVYFISQLPSQIQYLDIIYIAIAGFTMSVAAAVYPAWRASKILPAEALRYE
jgi:lipoprotein-releasing system permease protein